MTEFSITGPVDTVPPLDDKTVDPATCPDRMHHSKGILCDGCGETFPYGVRSDGGPRAKPGRKIPDGTSTPRRARSTGGSDKTRRALTERSQASSEDLASSATDVLLTYDSWVKAGIRFLQLNHTANAMDDAHDELRDRVHDALLMDPDLCRTILRSGAKTGKAALITAFGTYILAVAPVAYMEFRMSRTLDDTE